MKVECPNCHSRYKLVEDRLPAGSEPLKVRCKKCGSVFDIKRDEGSMGGPPEDVAIDWFVAIAGEPKGPISADEVRRMVRSGEIGAQTYVWRKGFAQWQRLRDVEEFAALLVPKTVTEEAEEHQQREGDVSPRSGAAPSEAASQEQPEAMPESQTGSVQMIWQRRDRPILFSLEDYKSRRKTRAVKGVEVEKAAADPGERAVRTLRMAWAWCKEVATAEGIKGRLSEGQYEDVEALRCVTEVRKALQQAVDYLRGLPDLWEAAKVGQRLREDLAGMRARLQEVAEDLSRREQEIAELARLRGELEEKVQEQEERRRELESSRAELERLRRLAEPQAIEALRAQVKQLEERLEGAQLAEVKDLEERLGRFARRLICLSEEHLQALSPQVNEVLVQAEAKEEELRETLANLDAAHKRYEQARFEVERIRQEIEPYLEADKLVAKALPGTNDILEMLKKVEYLFSEAEKALKVAMEASERKDRLSVLSVAGENVAR